MHLNIKNTRSTRCRVCGRPLKSPTSIERGVGTVCGRGFNRSYRKKKCQHTKDMFDAEFDYRMRGDALVIYDANLGGKSVTNDMENVLLQCIREIGKPDHDTPIVYMDTEGRFDGVNYDPINRTVRFYAIGAYTEKEALEYVKEKTKDGDYGF